MFTFQYKIGSAARTKTAFSLARRVTHLIQRQETSNAPNMDDQLKKHQGQVQTKRSEPGGSLGSQVEGAIGRMRSQGQPYRWQSGEIGMAAASAAAVNGWILEDGVQVKFLGKPEQYSTGQYWTIPARTATGDVIWPSDSGKPALIPPQGIVSAYAPLAIVTFKPDKTLDKLEDFRRPLGRLWK